MKYFILECSRLEDKRDQQIMRKFWRTDKDEMIGDMLFDRKETEKVGKMLEDMYVKRKRRIANQKRTIRNRIQT